MKKTLRVLCLVMCMLFISSNAMAAVTDPALNEVGSLPIVKEPVKLTVGINQNTYVPDYETNALSLLLEEHSGVELEFEVFPEVDAETKLMLMVTGGSELPDILLFGTGDTMRNQLADAGVLYPLDEYFDKENGIADQFYAACERYGVDSTYVLNLLRSTDGHIYTIPTVEQYMPNMYSYRAWINQDWLDALGLQAPTTIDELTQVLIAFRDNDPNGNGIKDEIPMSGGNASSATSNANVFTWLQNLFIYRDMTGNGYLPLSDTEGKLDVAYDKEEYREFLKYVNMLVKEDLLDEAAFTQTQTELRAQLQAETETIGMMFGSANGFAGNIASWQPLEQPEGYYGTRIVSVTNPTPQSKWMITSYCENPEVAFLLAMMCYDTTLGEHFWNYSARYGEKDVDWRYAEEGEVSIFKEIGIKPGLKVLQITWGNVSDKHWNNVITPYIGSSSTAIEVFDGNEAYGERLHGRSVSMNMQYAPKPSDVVGNILYTEEERDEWDEIRATLKNYLLESSALFAVGQLDPNSDEDWNDYLKELEVLRYQELLAADQVAYNRTMGIE